jgi:uroporphyrin-III C-methyltransferase/precorrin-2 dehydrogenase/sirohydrochlorin ferrochelatase
MSKVRPLKTTPARIAPLATLPLFHKLQGRKAVVVGASQGALWKAELLEAAGADVSVLRDGWTPVDLDGAAVAVADISDDAEARRFIDAAHAAGAVVNIIDRPEYCDVTFGTIVNRSPLVLGISTDGGAPMLGQSIRARIEAVLPRGLSAWAEAARAWRPRLRQRISGFADRRAFWERFVRRAWANVDRAPGEADFVELAGGAQPLRAEGSVILVGAGPGDPDLLTLKAVRALQAATVILYDDLVGPEILELARREATRIAVGKKGHGPSCRQSEINERIVALAEAGETVVRLKGGDPLIFGRATEEIEACQAAGVSVSIVPGISAAQGAAAALGFSLTERKHARSVRFVTGHGADGKLPTDIDWAGIADPAVTTLLYMPRRTLAEFARAALAHGLDPATPAAAIASATRPEQAHVTGSIAEIAALAESLPAGAPVIVIIGRVARHAAAADLEALLSEAA